MSRPGILIILGVLVILIPVSGLSSTSRSFLSILLGALVLGIGLSLRTRGTHGSPVLPSTLPTVDPLPPTEPHTPRGVSPI